MHHFIARRKNGSVLAHPGDGDVDTMPDCLATVAAAGNAEALAPPIRD